MGFSFTMLSLVQLDICLCWIKLSRVLKTQFDQRHTLFLLVWTIQTNSSILGIVSPSKSNSSYKHSQLNIFLILCHIGKNIPYYDQNLHRSPFWNPFTWLQVSANLYYLIIIALSMFMLNYTPWKLTLYI